MAECAPISTPFISNCKLRKEDESPLVDSTFYGSMIGIHLYLTSSRPYIMLSIWMVAWFQYAPKESHVMVAKIIFRYLKCTRDLGLWYQKTKEFELMAYTDANWAGSVDDWQRTSGSAYYLGEWLVSWARKKQSSISLSTTE